LIAMTLAMAPVGANATALLAPGLFDGDPVAGWAPSVVDQDFSRGRVGIAPNEAALETIQPLAQEQAAPARSIPLQPEGFATTERAPLPGAPIIVGTDTNAKGLIQTDWFRTVMPDLIRWTAIFAIAAAAGAALRKRSSITIA